MLIKTSCSLKSWILWRFLLTLVDFDLKKPFYFLKPYLLANMCIISFSCSSARFRPCIYQENLSIFHANSKLESFANFLQIVLFLVLCFCWVRGERLQTTHGFVYHCRNLQPTYAFSYNCSSTRSFPFPFPHDCPVLWRAFAPARPEAASFSPAKWNCVRGANWMKPSAEQQSPSSREI